MLLDLGTPNRAGIEWITVGTGLITGLGLLFYALKTAVKYLNEWIKESSLLANTIKELFKYGLKKMPTLRKDSDLRELD